MFTAADTTTATWPVVGARLRSRGLSCSVELGNAYGMKPSTHVETFSAIRPPRRGVPPI